MKQADKENNHINWKLFAQFLSAHKWVCGLMAVRILRASTTVLIPPWVLGRFVDQLYMPGQAWMWGAAWLAAGILAGVAESGQNSVIIVLGQKLMHFLRSRMAAKLSRLPFSYYTAHSSGEISSHFLNDVDAINVLFTEGIVALSANALKLLAIILVIGRTNIYLALLLCVILPFLWKFTRICQQSVRKAQLKQRSAIADVFSCLPETMAMLPVLQNLGMESFMENRYGQMIGRSFRAIERTNFFDSVYSPIIKMVTACTIAMMMVLAAGNVTGNYFHLSAGNAVSMIAYILALFSPLEALGMEIQSIQTAAAALERVTQFLELPEEKHIPIPGGSTKEVPEDVAACEFRHVSFAYEKGKTIFRDLNFTVRKGDYLMIQGRTGSGKTTLFRLLTGLIQPDSGEILMYGQSLDCMDRQKRRALFGIVEQKFEKVEGTLRDQITLHQGEPSGEDDTWIWHILEQVGLDSTVRQIPGGLDAEAESAGLSDGQWQLMGLARALYGNPRILLLDEFTAHVDTKTEWMLYQTLAKMKGQYTCIVISHRHMNMDNIHVLEL